MKKRHRYAWLFLLLCITSVTNVIAQKSGDDQTGKDFDDPPETATNTASMTASDGKTFKLVAIGDRVPRLFINGDMISRHDLPLYEETIEKLTAVIAERQQKIWEQQNAQRERLNRQLITDIVEKNLAAGKDDVRSYYLTSRVLKINGKIQDPDTFQFFRNRYVKSEDAVFYYERESANTFQKSTAK